MPLRPLPYHEVRRRLEAAGFAEHSRKGSHGKFVRQTRQGTRIAVVPQHREVAVGTLRSMLRQAGISTDEWEAL